MNNIGRYRCIVIDDEPIAIKVIVNYLDRIDGFEVVDTFTNALDALGVFREQQVDLLFLDIQMPGINGLEFFKTIHNPPKLIFTTAFRNFAVDAFEVDAIDYLVKPIPFERFLKAINKFLDIRMTKALTLPNDETNFIILKSDKKNFKVRISDILYIESLDDYVRVHTLHQKLVCYLRLSALEEQLKSLPSIVRIHRSFLINADHVKVFTSFSVDIADRTIPIGRNYRESVSGFLKR
jgi:DNA-binding LytR/AlgR family response regulator